MQRVRGYGEELCRVKDETDEEERDDEIAKVKYVTGMEVLYGGKINNQNRGTR